MVKKIISTLQLIYILKREKKKVRRDMMKSVSHYNNREHGSNPSMRLGKPQMKKGRHPPEVIPKTLASIPCLHTLHFLFIFVWIFSLPSAGSGTLSPSAEGNSNCVLQT